MVDFDLNLGDLRRKILNADLEQRTISPGVAILEKMSTPPVPFIECHGMTSHQSAHDLAERRGPCSNKQMNMVWNQCPSIALGLGLFKNDR